MHKIHIAYYDKANFGDALSPRLIQELSGIKTVLKHPRPSLLKNLRMLVGSIVRGNFSEISKIELPWQQTVVAIGSIISWSNKKSKVWGPGFMYSDEKFHGGKIYAVRGKLTNQRLKKLGHKGTSCFGDPALLLPLWLPPAKQKRYKLGIIPHWSETAFFQDKYGDRYKVIDLGSTNIEHIIDEITACDYVLSTSLHGVIVPHAYDIPALWIKKGYIFTDGFKFEDYFSSVDIPSYKGFENIDEILQDENSWTQLMRNNQDKRLINNSLREIQLNLLKVAPFSLKDKYQNMFCDVSIN